MNHRKGPGLRLAQMTCEIVEMDTLEEGVNFFHQLALNGKILHKKVEIFFTLSFFFSPIPNLQLPSI
jgi:hypothetical protein